MKKIVKRTIALILSIVMVASMLTLGVSAADTSGGFTDIADCSHAHAIEALAEVGILRGVGNGRFDPNGEVNRAMAVTVLGRMAGVKEDELYSADFADVDNDSWYTMPVSKPPCAPVM